MKKRKIVELIQLSLPGRSQSASYKPGFIEAWIDLAFMSALKQEPDLSSFMVTIDDVPVNIDSKGRYYIQLDFDPIGDMKVEQPTDQSVYATFVDYDKFKYLADAEVNKMDIIYCYRQKDKVYLNFCDQKTVTIKAVKPLDSLGDDDEIELPSGRELEMVAAIVDYLSKMSPMKTKNDNNPNTI